MYNWTYNELGYIITITNNWIKMERNGVIIIIKR